ncbi:hypothetical protein BRC86_06500 [Halobacteriales archaeon QS_3_64_16]|nr:MAG: hypothetical protein BRC86_06500 [Halobacteriales archaeon QS_3_64_16]
MVLMVLLAGCTVTIGDTSYGMESSNETTATATPEITDTTPAPKTDQPTDEPTTETTTIEATSTITTNTSTQITASSASTGSNTSDTDPSSTESATTTTGSTLETTTALTESDTPESTTETTETVTPTEPETAGDCMDSVAVSHTVNDYLGDVEDNSTIINYRVANSLNENASITVRIEDGDRTFTDQTTVGAGEDAEPGKKSTGRESPPTLKSPL